MRTKKTKKRGQQERRKWLKVGLLTLGIFMALSGAVWISLSSPLFLLREIIVVHPPKTLSEPELVILSGAKTGSNLLTLSLQQIESNLKQYRWIQGVKLTKDFPGRLLIEVTEQEPVAVVSFGELYYVNREGELFKKMSAADPKDFPVISGISREEFEQHPDSSRAQLRELAGLVENFSQMHVMEGIGLSEIHFDSGKGVSLFTLDPCVKITLGHEELGKKLQRLSGIFPSLAVSSAELLSIDLSYEQKIILKRKS